MAKKKDKPNRKQNQITPVVPDLLKKEDRQFENFQKDEQDLFEESTEEVTADEEYAELIRQQHFAKTGFSTSDNYFGITPAGTMNVWYDDPNNTRDKNQFSSHAEAERNFYSCQLSNFQLNDELGKYKEKYGELEVPTPPPSGDFRPEGSEQHFSKNGTIHKPVSDSDKKMVLVLNKNYCGASTAGMRVTLLDRNGAVLEQSLRFAGCANGNRPNHRSKYKASDLTGPIYYVWSFNGEQQFLVVEDPEKRYDG